MRTFLIVMVLALAIAVPAAASHQFSDVPTNHPHHSGIDWLVTNGITSGCDSDRFCPSDPLSRAQFATLLRNYDSQTTDETFTPRVRIVRAGIRADCPSGTVLVGGGVEESTNPVTHSYPSPDGRSWRAGPGAAYALCMELP